MTAPLPATVRDLLDEWELADGGESWDGERCAVVPVTTVDGTPAVLKVGEQPAHAHLALQHWHGRGAVRLLRADPGRGALLLERASRTDLRDHWDVEACEVVGGLYRELHRPAFPQLRRLSEHAAEVAAALAALPRDVPLPPRLVQQARHLAGRFAADPDTDGTVVHTDLHYGTVLAAERAPWLATSPRPLNGDPHVEVAPLLWHRYDELAGRVRDGLRARFHAAVDAAGLDEHRARDWVVVRAVDLARHRLGTDAVTRLVTIAKAVQD
ncbi:streptomycin 6-kinase [Nocardioides sp. J9]|uniref:aminoglycoside phosphotransferase family protein n=1 Tax=unclassified Nocardioides TaxID=2615069 RepID=UPI0004AFF45E|nr:MULTISPECIES: aminoglycoside phosphotransferase family protein [unclassified Nocardioides]TWG99615.1 streptomycin 6-kinase [Nocardioides sp. J9]